MMFLNRIMTHSEFFFLEAIKIMMISYKKNIVYMLCFYWITSRHNPKELHLRLVHFIIVVCSSSNILLMLIKL